MVSLKITPQTPAKESRTFVCLTASTDTDRSYDQHLRPEQAARWIEEAFLRGMHERGL